MSDTESVRTAAEPIVAQAQPQIVNQTIHRGGFLGGGWFSTLLFLMAFFLVSYSLGVVTERNTKLSTVGAVAGAQNGGTGNFNVTGFKKLAAELKLDTKKFDTCLDSGKYVPDVKKELDEGTKVGVNGTPSFVINGVALVGAQPMNAFQQVFAGAPIAIDPQATASASLYDGKRVAGGISMDNVRVKGDPNAPITIVEYSDFECPYCGRFYADTYKQIDAEYIKTGKAKLVFKDFPLTNHPQAPKAAEAARCAQEQGKFWEMHDKLFDLQLAS